MSHYRARACPNCRYYLVLSVAKPFFRSTEAAVTSFCLNCSYKVPIRGVIRGTRRVVSSIRRKWLRLANVRPLPARPVAGRDGSEALPGRTTIDPKAYSRHLRTLGQELEKLQVTDFNLECRGASYLVWGRSLASGAPTVPEATARRWRLLRQRAETPRPGQRESSLEYLDTELERLDRLAREQRRAMNGPTDGHSLSQLMRTVGALASERNHRLLGVSWRDFSIYVVIETAQGKREIEVFRPDNLYDLWVRMYLRRNNRTLSDVPQ